MKTHMKNNGDPAQLNQLNQQKQPTTNSTPPSIYQSVQNIKCVSSRMNLAPYAIFPKNRKMRTESGKICVLSCLS